MEITRGFWDDAEVISVYTRQQAITDGVLREISATMVEEAGFKLSTAITERLHGTIKTAEGHGLCSYDGALWDILQCMKWTARNNRGKETDRVYFRVKIGMHVHDLYCVCGPDDTGMPCLTIMFRDED